MRPPSGASAGSGGRRPRRPRGADGSLRRADIVAFDLSIFVSLALLFGITAQFRAADGYVF
ncbi:MAG: hypothetical protein JRN07_03780, partial [Nitrososphaerota archaeon]|nr:hypothetical protein [Nitrososphaerota archaeon]